MLINPFDALGLNSGQVLHRFGNYQAKAIEAARIIRGAANYAPVLICAPKVDQQAIAARGSWRGTANVGKRGYILGVSAYASNASGFKLQIKDLGNGKNFFVQPLNFANVTAQASGTPQNQVFYFPRPHMVKAPGQVEVQITSLATATQNIEVVLHTAQELFDSDPEGN